MNSRQPEPRTKDWWFFRWLADHRKRVRELGFWYTLAGFFTILAAAASALIAYKLEHIRPPLAGLLLLPGFVLMPGTILIALYERWRYDDNRRIKLWESGCNIAGAMVLVIAVMYLLTTAVV